MSGKRSGRAPRDSELGDLSFIGEFEHSLDEKGRLVLPKEFRKNLEGEFILSLGFDGCIQGWRRDAWRSFVETELEKRSLLGRNSRDLSRFFHSNAQTVSFDSLGRVLILPALRRHAGIEREVTVVGAGRHFEVWSRDAWRDYFNRVSAGLDSIAESLSKEYLV